MHIIESRNGYIEKFDSEDRSDIYDTINWIRKDCWAYFIDYAECKSCETSFTKSDIFWNISKSNKHTITELEILHPDIWHNCVSCSSTLETKRKNKSSDDLKDRLENTLGSSLVVYKDNKINTIQWFSLAYADTFENIYNREFAPYFNDSLREVFEPYMKEVYITVAATCLNEPHKHLAILFDLIKSAFFALDKKFSWYPATSEFIIWSVSEKIYDLMWCEKMNLFESNPEVYPGKIISDIWFHNNAYNIYTDALNIPISQILKMRKLRK